MGEGATPSGSTGLVLSRRAPLMAGATTGLMAMVTGAATAVAGGEDRLTPLLGSRYDIKALPDAVPGCGRVPLDIFDRVGTDWIASQARA